ncbi:MAG: hypothetical protein RI101_10555 [Nitrospira sp.]|jgi:hypothetical protein|nr:hypothetical protein [Nitrospira sp.]
MADTHGLFDPALIEQVASVAAILLANGKANARVISLVGRAMPEVKGAAHKLFE